MPRRKKASEISLNGRDLYRLWARRHRPHPPVLYQYTTAPGLLSMIKSGHMWATESRYMNDPREFLHGADIILQVIKRIAARPKPPEALLEVRANVQRHLEEKLQNVRIFFVSFCTKA